MLGIYTRLSKEDNESVSITQQLYEGKQFATKNNLQYNVYNEGEGLSGSLDIADRPQLDKLVKDINKGIISVVWARNQQRLERNNIVYGFFVKLVKQFKVKVFFADKEYDFNNPADKLQGSIMSSISEYQLELQSVQTKKTQRNNAEQGKVSGHITYGYMADKDNYQVPNPETVPIIQEIFTRYNNGEGGSTITDDINKRNIPPIFKKGNKSGKWSYNALYTILKNPIYIGEKKLADKIYDIEPIIDKDLFNRVQTKLKVGAKKQSMTYFYLLNNLLTCKKCGGRIAGRSYGKLMAKYYICTRKRHHGCDSKMVRIDLLDGWIWGIFTDDDLYNEAEDAYKQGDNTNEKNKINTNIKHFTKEQEKLLKKLDRVKNAVVEGLFTIKEGKDKAQKINSSITDAKDKVMEAKQRLKEISGEKRLLKELKKNINTKDDEIDQLFHRLDNLDTIGKDKKELSRIIKKYIKEIVVNYNQITVKFLLPIKDKKLTLRNNKITDKNTVSYDELMKIMNEDGI